MKKTKPKYPIEYPVEHSFYGHHSCTDGKGTGKKSTYMCTVAGCTYTARVPRWQPFDKMRTHNVSIHCPSHKVELKNIGDVLRLPKNAKKRQKLISDYLNTD